MDMPPIRDLRSVAGATARGARATASGTGRASRWVGRNVGHARRIGGANNAGMMRLLDLHAVSCAGDTLVTIGLAGTIFFAVPAGEARGRVALYLLVTMVPFALLAPVVGPVLDRFRHGRRLALAATMLGRAALAWVIADNLFGFGLYAAAFGVLALSRAYGVAERGGARLLPKNGPVPGGRAPRSAGQWPGPSWLRWASGVRDLVTMATAGCRLIFLVGVIVALALPAEGGLRPAGSRLACPRPWRHPGRRRARILSGRLVLATLIAVPARALYGFSCSSSRSRSARTAPAGFLGIHLNAAPALR
jgi:hypothetical protein